MPSARSAATHSATSSLQLWSTTSSSVGHTSPAATERKHSRSSGRPTVGITTVMSVAMRDGSAIVLPQQLERDGERRLAPRHEVTIVDRSSLPQQVGAVRLDPLLRSVHSRRLRCAPRVATRIRPVPAQPLVVPAWSTSRYSPTHLLQPTSYGGDRRLHGYTSVVTSDDSLGIHRVAHEAWPSHSHGLEYRYGSPLGSGGKHHEIGRSEEFEFCRTKRRPPEDDPGGDTSAVGRSISSRRESPMSGPTRIKNEVLNVGGHIREGVDQNVQALDDTVQPTKKEC